jgi:hypothetical protein
MAQYIDVRKDYNATGRAGDSIDDTDAIQAAIDAAARSSYGVHVFFPEGRYLVSGLRLDDASHVVLQGAGRELSVIVGQGSANIVTATSGTARDVTIRDLGFESSTSSKTAIDLNGRHFSDALLVERCRFYKMHGIRLVGVTNVRITGSLFHGGGANQVDALTFGDVFTPDPFRGGADQIVIERNEFRYMRNGIQVHTPFVASPSPGHYIAHDYESVRVTDNYFDGGWFSQLANSSGSGATVTYPTTAPTRLIDTSRTFAFTAEEGVYVRVPTIVASSGTAAPTYDGIRVGDADPNAFTGILRGDFVESGSAWALVNAIESGNVLYVDEWLSATDRTPVPPPANGAPYTIYRPILGKVLSGSGNTLTIARWMILTGQDAAVPSSGMRYEIISSPGNHPMFFGTSVHSLTVSRNRVLRGYADQISVGGYHCNVSNNIVEDGQDMGITVENTHTNAICGNVIRGQGANCIIVSNAHDNILSGNICVDAYRGPGPDATRAAGICIDGGSRNVISTNHFERLGTSPMSLGVTVLGASDANVVSLNTFRDPFGAVAPRYLAAGTSNDTQFLDNSGGTAARAGSASVVTMRVAPPPRVLAYQTSAQSLPYGIWTALTFDAEEQNIGGIHSIVANNERFTCPAGAEGVYLAIAQLAMAPNSAGLRQLRIVKNGDTWYGWTGNDPWSSGASMRLQVSSFIPMSAGDWIAFEVLQDSGASRDTHAGATQNTFGSLAKIA